jgi:hypothetical protein
LKKLKDHLIFDGIEFNENGEFGFHNILARDDIYSNNGISGWEMDVDVTGKYTDYMIAKGTNPENKGCEVMLNDTGDFKLLSVGSVLLSGAVLVDKGAERFVFNAINYFLE